MNLESLWIGQNLSCRCTAGKTGLICWKAPGAGFNSVELTTGWLGPSLIMAGPCGAVAPPCTKFGLAGEKFGPSAPGLLGGRFGPSVLGLLGGRFGASALGLLKGRFGRSALGLLSGRPGLTCCTLGFTA